MLVSKRGNSLAIRMPASLVEALGSRAGGEIGLHVAGVRASEIQRRPTRHGVRPADFEFERARRRRPRVKHIPPARPIDYRNTSRHLHCVRR